MLEVSPGKEMMDIMFEEQRIDSQTVHELCRVYVSFQRTCSGMLIVGDVQ